MAVQPPTGDRALSIAAAAVSETLLVAVFGQIFCSCLSRIVAHGFLILLCVSHGAARVMLEVAVQ